MLFNLYYKVSLKRQINNKMKQKVNRIQEVIWVNRIYCVSLRNLIPHCSKGYGLISPKIKWINHVNEIAVPQISLTSVNFRSATSHKDSVDQHFDLLGRKINADQEKIQCLKKQKLNSFYFYFRQETCLFIPVLSRKLCLLEI